MEWQWVTCGCFLKWWYPQIIHFDRVFHYKPSILGYHYFWKPPCRLQIDICWLKIRMTNLPLKVTKRHNQLDRIPIRPGRWFLVRLRWSRDHWSRRCWCGNQRSDQWVVAHGRQQHDSTSMDIWKFRGMFGMFITDASESSMNLYGEGVIKVETRQTCHRFARLYSKHGLGLLALPNTRTSVPCLCWQLRVQS